MAFIRQWQRSVFATHLSTSRNRASWWESAERGLVARAVENLRKPPRLQSFKLRAALIVLLGLSATAVSAEDWAYNGMLSVFGEAWHTDPEAACADYASRYYQAPGNATSCSLSDGTSSLLTGRSGGFVAPQFCRLRAYCVGEFVQERVNPIQREPMADRGAPPPSSCPAFGHPIRPASGHKIVLEPLGVTLGGQSLVATYNSLPKLPTSSGEQTRDGTTPAAFGPLWSSTWHRHLVLQRGRNTVILRVTALRGDGQSITFALQPQTGAYEATSGESDRLIQTTFGWRYYDAARQTVEDYDGPGPLLRAVTATGAVLTPSYSDANTPADLAPEAGLMMSLQDNFGRVVQFRYERESSGAVRLRQIVDADGRTVDMAYGTNGQLATLTLKDGRTRSFLYEQSDLPWALTGVVDELGQRQARYGYDTQGRAVETQTGSGADHYAVSYPNPPVRTVTLSYDDAAGIVWRDSGWQAPDVITLTTPQGTQVQLQTAITNGTPRLTSQSQPAGAGCAASTSAQTYDAKGNVASVDDFNGTRSCYVTDATRNLRTVSVEGLSKGQACETVTAANAALPAGARKTSTQWHPDWSLQSKQAVPGQITTWIYNGLPDPFNGNAVASCAPAAALLPDGKPIAVLCKKVEQATTDTDGHLAFSAALQGGVANRVSTWTYNEAGQVLTAKGPRTNVNATTSRTYYIDTTADHTLGDLKTTTNAVGKVTTYDKYNKVGQLLQSTDPNGIVTVRTYDLRQRLLSISIGGEASTYGYDLSGQLLQVTQADGSWIGYEYDTAHRQKAVKDNLGNRIDYTIDNAGSRTAEDVKDPAGILRRSVARINDALGRAQQSTGRE